MRIPWNKGKKGLVKQSPDTIQKRLESFRRVGFKPGVVNRGRKRSEEFKQKIRDAHKRGDFDNRDLTAFIEATKKRNASPEWAKEISKRQQGSGSSFWRGGVTKINDSIRNHPRYAEWRYRVYERDGFHCLSCGADRDLNADHVIPFSYLTAKHKIKSVNQALGCSELWDISNGRTLCVGCHKKTDTWGIKSRWGNWRNGQEEVLAKPSLK